MSKTTIVLDAVARHYGYMIADLKGPRRFKALVRARHTAMYLIREDLELSYPEIGRLFQCDHSSVQHAHKKMREAEQSGDPDLAGDLMILRQMIENRQVEQARVYSK